MALVAFDIGQDWSSTELALWLFFAALFLLAYIAVFGILAGVRSRRKKCRENLEKMAEACRRTRRGP